jgi:hypothetical protein
MKEMYKEIYKDLCSTDLVIEPPEIFWQNKQGEAVELEEQAFGIKTNTP